MLIFAVTEYKLLFLIYGSISGYMSKPNRMTIGPDQPDQSNNLPIKLNSYTEDSIP